MGDGARRSFGLALGDLMVFFGEVVVIIGEGIRTGDDALGLPSLIVGGVAGFPNRVSDRLDMPGILTGVEGRRGLVSPLFGLRGCGRDLRGLPRGLVMGLGRGVLGPGVRVSELDTVLIPVPEESIDTEGLTDKPVALSGIRYFIFIRS